MKQIHIIVLENSFIIREGLQALLSRLKFVHAISFVSTLEELETLMKQHLCHLVIVNPEILQTNSAQILHLKNQYECVRLIGIIYAHFSNDLLSKLDGTIDIFDSRETITSKMTKWMESENGDNLLQSKDTLTDREISVLRILAEGKSNKEIADQLNISINTVITHRKNISQKTGIKSVSGLTIYAVVQNLISLDDFSG